MKRILELNLGALMLLTVAVGCGGSTSSDPGAGRAPSSAGNPDSPNGGAVNGGASATPAGGAHSGGQTSNPGSAGASTNGGFSTSLSGSTPLKDLTPDQVTQLCGELADFLNASFANFGCQAQAVVAAAQTTTDAEAQSTCKTTLAACGPDQADGGMCDTQAISMCPVTVGDAALCFNDTGAAIKTLGSSIPSCEGLTLAQAQAAVVAFAASDNAFKEPASCAKLSMQCPDSTPGMP